MKRYVDVVLCYDFDGTLAAGNMQEYGFIKRLNVSPSDFWAKSDAMAAENSADKNLCYMIGFLMKIVSIFLLPRIILQEKRLIDMSKL